MQKPGTTLEQALAGALPPQPSHAEAGRGRSRCATADAEERRYLMPANQRRGLLSVGLTLSVGPTNGTSPAVDTRLIDDSGDHRTAVRKLHPRDGPLALAIRTLDKVVSSQARGALRLYAPTSSDQPVGGSRLSSRRAALSAPEGLQSHA